jgi:hypothetical protein
MEEFILGKFSPELPLEAGVPKIPQTFVQRPLASEVMTMRSVSLLVGMWVLPIQASLAAEPVNRVTILYDAFGKDSAMKKDWGFSALVEYHGRRVLFDTGNDASVFAGNGKAPGLT